MGRRVSVSEDCLALSSKPVYSQTQRRLMAVFAVILAGTLGWPATVEAQLPQAEAVVTTGETPPDAATGAYFTAIQGLMDTRGRVLIEGTLQGTGITTDNDRGLWISQAGGGIASVVRQGDAAPDLPGLTLDGILSGPYPSALIGYQSFLAGPGVTINNHLASFGGGNLVTRVGEPAPGMDPSVTWSAGINAANSAGQYMVFGTLFGSGIDSTNDEGIWLWTQGVFTPVVRLGDSADGGGTFGSLRATLGNRGFNDLSIVAFQGAVEKSPGVYSRGIWAGPPGGVQLVVEEGDMVPTSSGSAAIDILQVNPILDQTSSSMVFSAQVNGGQVGLWYNNGTSAHRLLGLQNEQIGGETYWGFSPPVISGGSVAFRASFYSSGTEGIVLDRLGTQTLIAHAGDPAPGAPPGAVFESFYSPAINSLGQVVFKARMTGPPISATNQDGIWVWRSDGVLEPVALQGVPLSISPGGSKVPTAVGFSGGYNAGQGKGIALTNSGKILFVANFNDGTRSLLLSLPETFSIFQDGFETGNTSFWSSTVQ